MPTVTAPVLFSVSDTTLKILRNFGSLHNELLLLEGKQQHTHLKSKSILAVAELPEAWPQETGIFNMTQFLGVLSTYKAPTIRFDEKALVILDPAQPEMFSSLDYGDPSVIGATEQKSFPHEGSSVEFTLSDAAFASLKKNASLLDLKYLTITISKGGKVQLVARGESGSKGWQSNIVAETVNDASFTHTSKYMIEHFTMLLDGGYRVRVADWPYAYFIHKTLPVTYYVAQKKKGE